MTCRYCLTCWKTIHFLPTEEKTEGKGSNLRRILIIGNTNDLTKASVLMILTPSFSASNPCILLGHLVLKAMVSLFLDSDPFPVTTELRSCFQITVLEFIKY